MGNFRECKRLSAKNASISKIIDIVRKSPFKFENPWFRGQPDYSYKLIPSLFRKGNDVGCEYDEAVMVKEFKRRYHEYGHVRRSEFEWLSLMQHHGFPTRLLDWSTNIMVALYFACRDENDKKKCDAALYVYDDNSFPEIIKSGIALSLANIDDYNDFDRTIFNIQIKSRNVYHFCNLLKNEIIPVIMDGDNCDDISIEWEDIKHCHEESQIDPIIIAMHYNDTNDNTVIKLKHTTIMPKKIILPYTDTRMQLQHARFTIHHGKYFKGETFIKARDMVENPRGYNYNLLKIKIPAETKEKILEELRYVGITEATLFPEMEHQTDSIKEIARFKLNPLYQ